ncbi:MAG: flippase [Phycisphaerales bacterium]|nr:flippase [Phycisphaerales bacterium]
MTSDRSGRSAANEVHAAFDAAAGRSSTEIAEEQTATGGGASAGAIRRLALGAGTIFVAKVANTGAKFVTQVVVARLLGAEHFGLYALCIVIYQIAELFAGMGLDSGSVRFGSIHHGNGDAQRLKGVIRDSMTIPAAAGVCLGLALFLSADLLASGVFHKPAMATGLRIAAVALPFGSMMNVAAFATTASGVTHYLAYVWTAHPTMNLLLAGTLCAMGLGLAGAIWAWVAASVVCAGFAAWCVRATWPHLVGPTIQPLHSRKELLSYSWPLAMGSFVWLVLLWTDILVLGYFGTEEEVGVYRASSQTSLLLTMIIVSLNTIFTPTIADLLNRRQTTELHGLFRASTRWSLAATVPMFLMLCVCSRDLLRIFGSGFERGAASLVVLAAGQLVTAGTGSCGQILAMAGRQYLKLYGDLAMAIMNIVLNLLLVPAYGILGAAAATAVSVGFVHVLRLVQVYRVIGIYPYNGSFVRVLVAGTAAGAAAAGVRALLPNVQFVVALVVLSIAILVVYLPVLWMMGIENEDKTLFRDMWRRIRGRRSAIHASIGDA